MKFATVASTRYDLEQAMHEVVDAARRALDQEPDLAFVFTAGHDPEQSADAVEDLHEVLSDEGHLIGCTAGGVIGGGHEIEMRPAITATVASLPGVRARPFHLDPGRYPDDDAPPSDWHRLLGVAPADRPAFILLPDPFTAEAPRLLAGLDYAYPGAVKVGGLASGAQGPGGNRLFMDLQSWPGGTVGVALTGSIVVDPVVAQGARPVGAVGRITKCDRNFLVEVDGRRALEFFQQQLEALTEADQKLARWSLCLGIAMDPFADRQPEPGDFLIRNLIGADQENGVIAVGEFLTAGRCIQLHVRDPRASGDDLDAVLHRAAGRAMAGHKPAGALLFSCLGRGRSFYGRPDHDSEKVKAVLGELPIGGFFCAGEIGPVGATTFLHGYTSSFAVFRPR